MNKKNIIFWLLAVTTLSAFSQKSGEYLSKPFTGLTPRDGKAYLDIMQYDDKSKFMYLIRNDDKHLYIDILMSDRDAIQRAMMFGLTTWVDTLGKKKKDMGIVFPTEGNGERGMPGRAEGGKDRREIMALAMQEKNSHMVLKGFKGKGSEEEINPMLSQDIRGKFDRLEGELVRIALVVPLAMIGKEGEAKGNPLSIGFETGYLDLNRSGMAPSGGGERGGGGGYYGGGGPPGGGPPGGGESMDRSGSDQQRPDLNALATPNRLWIKKVMLYPGE